MSDPVTERSKRLRLSRRSAAVAISALVLLGSCASVWWIAAQARTPEQRAANTAPPPASQTTAEVSKEPLVERLDLTGSVAAASRSAITGSAPSGAARAVVTALPVKVGDSVTAGSAVAEVSGRPILVLPGRFPAYRDLRIGDKGPDVRQLQQALHTPYGVPVTGTYGPATAAAVKRLYEAAQYDAPVAERPVETGSSDGGAQGGDAAAGNQKGDADAGNGAETDGGTGTAETPGPGTSSADTTPNNKPHTSDQTVAGGLLPAAEVAFIGSFPVTVVEVGGRVGGDAEQPLVVLGNGGQHISATLTADQRTQLRDLPDGARILFGEGPYKGRSGRLHTLRAVKGSDENAKGESAGGSKDDESAQQEALFKPKGGPATVPSGTSQHVTVELRRSPADAFKLPVSAVWTDVGGSSVVTVVRGKEQHEVPVEVVFTFDGLAAVRATEDGLRSGDKVLLSRMDGTDG
ncbi:peptidoglycan-binding domain-containing protein [Streptomyces sp. E11-3]|uniref:peptidoglycan-binding domain-containing protein n=1 Tax=Streptomyces sp. E11-3 TaxID=3110112 RepID=UPI00397FAD0A